MATGPGFPGNNNTYVPQDISGRLTVGFSRNAKRFHLPRYVQYIEAPKSTAYYLKLTAQEAARVVSTNDYIWPDGQPDTNDEGTESFNFVPFTTTRYRYKFRLGTKSEEQASWPIYESHAQIKAAQCMTARTVRMLSAATTTSNWAQSGDTDNLSADHYSTATALAGAKFDTGTGTNPVLKNGLGIIAELINKDTLGVIDSDPDAFHVLMNPKTARQIAASPEIHEYIGNSMAAQQEIREGSHPNGKYGLPGTIYGYKIIVENAVKVTTRKGATVAKSHCLADGTVLVVSRPGNLEGVYGAPTFSTLTMFWWKDE